MIEDLHNYSVGNAGILVHNTSWCDDAIRSLANRVKSGAATIDEVLEIGIESGIDQQSLRALIDDLAGAGIAPSPSVLARVDNVLNHVTPPWPRELFTLQTNRGAGKIEHILEYTGQNNTGYLHTHFIRATGDLEVNLIKVRVHKTGLGSELKKQILSVIEGLGHEIKTISGQFSRREGTDTNYKIWIELGFHETPSYKHAIALGFTEEIQAPSLMNGYRMIMGKP